MATAGAGLGLHRLDLIVTLMLLKLIVAGAT
jgi:hypothetical protein